MSYLNYLENLIDSFGASLPGFSSTGTTNSHSDIILMHTMTYASKIQLHSASNTLSSKAKSVEAARNAVGLVSQWQFFAPGHGPLVLNPMIGVLWGIIGRVLATTSDGIAFGRRNEVTDSLERLIEAMETFGEWSPLIGGFGSSF